MPRSVKVTLVTSATFGSKHSSVQGILPLLTEVIIKMRNSVKLSACVWHVGGVVNICFFFKKDFVY